MIEENKPVQVPPIIEKKTFKEKFIGFLTPKRTEEIKPNLFIQQINQKGQPDKYRQITPVAWKGKIINWIVFWLGANPIRSTITFLTILLICFGYVQNNNTQGDFYNQVIFNQSFVQGLCKLNVENNLTDIYELNITTLCASRIVLNNESTILDLRSLNWSLK